MIVPRPRIKGESALRGSAARSAVDGREVVLLAPGGLVLEVASEREVRAREGNLIPGNLSRLDQGDLEAFGPDSVARRRQCGAKEDMHLMRVQHVNHRKK